MPKFDEEAVVDIAYENEEVKNFEEAHPDNVVNIEKVSPKETEAWIGKNPDADIGSPPPKNLWKFELEVLGKEKLVAIISPVTKKVIDVKTEESEAFPEEEEEEEEEPD